jgi:hypothetical protein
MTGRVREADSLFKMTLTDDSLFRLDPVRTSPKIYDVYYSARVAWQRERPSPVVAPLPAWRYGLYLCPFGAGQFYNRERAKGVALCVVQALALGASFIYYNTRQDLYSPDYGWYAGNLEKNRSAMTGVRVTFGLATAAWAYGAIDAFRADKRRGLK